MSRGRDARGWRMSNLRDHAAAAKAGIPRADLYEDPREELLDPPRPEVPMVLGRCPIDGTALYQSSCRVDELVCEWQGHRFRWPE